MKIEKTEVYGLRASLRGLRNPMDSWGKSDSLDECPYNSDNWNEEGILLGKADAKLSQSLTKAGGEHSKHLRLIQVWADLTLPRYIWQELDTYKHTEKVSCSTMHKLMSYGLNKSMFEGGEDSISDSHLEELNLLISKYINSSDKIEKKELKLKLKRKLPESFLQKRTINTNYQQLLNMYSQRVNHELPEWKPICDWILELPYFIELTGIKK